MSQLCAFLSAMWLCIALEQLKLGYRGIGWVGLAMSAFMAFTSWFGA